MSLNENVRNIVQVSKISQKELDRRLSEIQSEVGSLPETERQLLNIQRKFNVNDRIYTFLLEKRAEAAISKASNIPSNSILDRARKASMVYPKPSMNFTIAFLIGLLLPVLIILIRDYFDDKIHSRADIESLTDVPILGVISHSTEKYNTIVISRPKSIIAETFRSLRTNLQFIAAEKDKRVFTITSTLSGEGKTFTAINMASIFALSGKKTLLLSCDLRKPKLYDDFNLNNEKGMTTYLVGRCSVNDIVQSSGYEFLDIVTSGPVPPNPSELLESKRMNELMEEMRQEYDFIVIDSPPVGLVTDAVFLMKQSDANIYVVRQNYSSKHAMSTLNDLVRSTGLKNITIAVNDVDFTDRAYGRTGYGYGYGYGYGNEYGYYYGGENEGKKKSKKRWKAFLGFS
jgi:tyrosine-protein kinase Etk/Wzc